MNRKFALFLFALGVGMSAAHAGDPDRCWKFYQVCDPFLYDCWEQYEICLNS